MALIKCPECGKEISSYANACPYCGMPASLIKHYDLDAFHIKNGCLTTYTGTTIKQVIIPEGVTSIGDYAFSNCSHINSITIPDGVTSIGKCAFKNCQDLREINIPNSITNIGEGAFYGCKFLTNITIPNKIKTIEKDTFYDCHSLSKIQLPDGLEEINDAAFFHCSKIEKIVIPNSVKTIGGGAFGGCTDLFILCLPNGLTNIGKDIFYDTKNLRYNEYKNGYYLGSDTNPYFVLISVIDKDEYDFVINDRCEIIYKSAFFYYKKLKQITIPSSVRIICPGAFYNCEELQTVEFNKPSKLEKIDGIFNDCQLSSIVIPNSVKEINCSFRNCLELQRVDFEAPSKLERIVDFAFDECGVSFIVIPNSVKEIGYCTFNECWALQGITFEETHELECIGESAFKKCGLSSIVIPNSVKEIGDCAFKNCLKLQKVEFEEQSKLERIGEFAFNECGLSSISIPNSVKEIGSWAFSDCPNLIFNTYDNFNYLGNKNNIYFALIAPSIDAKNIADIKIPYNTKIIADRAFAYCNMSYISLPNTVIAIGDKAFYECDKLETIKFCESLITLNDGLLTGTKNLKELIIPNGITSIGDLGGGSRLEKVFIGDDVKFIHESAFYYKQKLTIITNNPYVIDYCKKHDIIYKT